MYKCRSTTPGLSLLWQASPSFLGGGKACGAEAGGMEGFLKARLTTEACLASFTADSMDTAGGSVL